MPMRFASSCTFMVSFATSGFATTLRLGLLPTSSFPYRSKIRPRAAASDMVRVRFDSACSAYSELETSCMDQSLASSMPSTVPEKTPSPRRRV